MYVYVFVNVYVYVYVYVCTHMCMQFPYTIITCRQINDGETNSEHSTHYISLVQLCISGAHVCYTYV